MTTDLPLQPIKSHHNWNHLSGIQLADPGFGQPVKIDLLLSVEIYAEVILYGRRSPKDPPTVPDDLANFALYVKDKFCLSDAAYKELSQLTLHFPDYIM